MADITVTQSTVKPTNANTLKAVGVSGEAINIGQGVYADPADNYRIKKARANSTSTTHAPNLVGIALSNAQGADQPITYATGGDVTFGSGLTKGQVYVVSAAVAGNIAPYADLVATNFVAVLGVALDTSILRVSLIPTSVQK